MSERKPPGHYRGDFYCVYIDVNDPENSPPDGNSKIDIAQKVNNVCEKILPGKYRGNFFYVDSQPRKRSLLQKVLNNIAYEKPLSLFYEQRLMQEVGRTIDILHELDEPNPDFSFLKKEEPLTHDPIKTFRTILEENEKRTKKESQQIRELRAGIKIFAEMTSNGDKSK